MYSEKIHSEVDVELIFFRKLSQHDLNYFEVTEFSFTSFLIILEQKYTKKMVKFSGISPKNVRKYS